MKTSRRPKNKDPEPSSFKAKLIKSLIGTPVQPSKLKIKNSSVLFFEEIPIFKKVKRKLPPSLK